MNINSIKVITPDNLGKGITFNPQTKKWEVQSGFDCAALSALPSKPWKKGTTLLAKQDGECIQLTALDSIFQEIGVGIAADKTSAFTGETYNVTVTVTNTGESKNELTNLTVQKPLLGNYEILDVRTSKQAVDEVETLDQLNYNLKGLAKGGTFILRFSVKANDVGTYQFSATVNPNSALDQNSKNNTDTIILKANTKIDTTYVPSVDCPRITATELDSNTQLVMIPSTERSSRWFRMYDGANVFANRENLKGLRIRLDGASTVYVLRTDDRTTQLDALVEFENGKIAYTWGAEAVSFEPGVAIKRGIDGYTFSDNILEFTKEHTNVMVLCRPAGKNCKWQLFNVRGAAAPNIKRIESSNASGGEVIYETILPENDESAAAIVNAIPSSIKYKIDNFKRVGINDNNARFLQKLIFKVRSGTAASLDINGREFNADVIPRTAGKTTITENHITVAAEATSTDSINSQYLQVIVED